MTCDKLFIPTISSWKNIGSQRWSFVKLHRFLHFMVVFYVIKKKEIVITCNFLNLMKMHVNEFMLELGLRVNMEISEICT